jgi:hypothetical protein
MSIHAMNEIYSRRELDFGGRPASAAKAFSGIDLVLLPGRGCNSLSPCFLMW